MNHSFFLTRLFQRKAYWLVPSALLLLLGALIGDAQARPEAQWVYDHHFMADATSDSIQGWNWTPETTVQVTINDPGTPAEPDYSASSQVGACNPEISTYFCLELEDQFDIRPGLVIDVTDYITTTKTTVVTTLLVYGMNAEEDTVWGIADPGVDVRLLINSWLMKVTPDQDGYWLADFTGLYDIQLMDGGFATQSDEDGDSTIDLFIYPSFIFGPYGGNNNNEEALTGYSWLPYQQIDFQVDDPSTGEINPDFSLSVYADEDGLFALGWDGEPDIQPGFIITATDGYMTKVHTVTHLDTLGANADQDTVWGIADPGITVTVFLGPASLQVMPDQNGSWTVDFTGIYDAQPGEGGGSDQTDDDGDSTFDAWRVPEPSFLVQPQEESISGNGWLINSQATIQIDDPTNGTGTDFSTSAMTNEIGYFIVELNDSFDIQSGFIVTVTDGNMTKEHTVTDLNILGIDIEDDTIWGTADPGITIGVYVWTAPYSLDVHADENGDWIADFTALYDLGIGDRGDSVQHDNDGDGTAIRWNIPIPTILADWKKDRVGGGWWTPGSTIQVSIYSTPGDTSPVFTTSVPVVGWEECSDCFELNLSGYFDLQPGQWIEATDGRTTKSMTVSRVQHTIVNDVYDTVSGIAEPGFAVYISCNGEFTEGGLFVS